MPIPIRNKGEHENDFIQRCMSDEKMKSEYPTEQRYAVCKNQVNLARLRISFDFDDTLNTKKGFELANSLKDENILYVISARTIKQGMLERTRKLGIPDSRVYATGSNEDKIQKVKDLKIDEHIDNNKDVIDALPNVGKLFTNN